MNRSNLGRYIYLTGKLRNVYGYGKKAKRPRFGRLGEELCALILPGRGDDSSSAITKDRNGELTEAGAYRSRGSRYIYSVYGV